MKTLFSFFISYIIPIVALLISVFSLIQSNKMAGYEQMLEFTDTKQELVFLALESQSLMEEERILMSLCLPPAKSEPAKADRGKILKSANDLLSDRRKLVTDAIGFEYSEDFNNTLKLKDTINMQMKNNRDIKSAIKFLKTTCSEDSRP